MFPRISPSRPAAFVLVLLAAPISLAAQAGSPPTTLEGRMGAFLRAVVEEGRDSVAAYFPRRGDWLWVHRTVEGPKDAPPGAWRFRGDETPRVLGDGGPLCQSFEQPAGESGPFERAIGWWASTAPTGWRRVGRTRFVPPGEPARSPAYVEWRREDGAWVVSAIGDDQPYWEPQPPGPGPNEATRDRRPRPADGIHAAGTEWYVQHKPIFFEGMSYVKYGLPRALAAHEIERIGTLGEVGVYAEAGRGAADVDVLYVPVGPGEYQPYQGFGSHACR